MKKFFLVFFLILLLAGGGVFFAIKKYVNTEEIEARVVAAVKEKTGRDIAFDRIRIMPFVTPLPVLMVKLENVTFSNAPGSAEKNMASLGALELRLALRPLLDKRVEIVKFTLDKPVIRLEVGADGRKNWEFAPAKKEGAEKPAAAPAAAPSSTSYTQDLTFKFSQIEIVKGSITYIDRKGGTNVALDKVDLNISYPDLDSGVQMDGWAEYKSQRVSMFLNLDKPRDLAGGGSSQGKLTLKAEDLFSAAAEGKLATAGTMLKGKLDADVTALPKFAAWLSGGKQQEMPFTHVKFSSAAEFSATALKLDNAKLALDEVQADGDVTLGLASAKPSFTARAKLNKLNLDRFTGGPKEAGAGGGKDGGKPGKQDDWDSAPIDFSGLKAVNADLVLNTAGFSLRGADVGPSTLTVLLKDGNLRFKSSEASLFSGRFLSDLSLDASQKTPSATFKFGMSDVEAKPLLTTFADFDKLSGKMDAVVDVSATGSSQKALIGNLGGNGNFNFKNGSLKGIDFVNIMSSIQKRLGEMGVGEGKTDFVDMGGTFTVANGIAKNDDLKMRGPLVQTTGAGTVDLPRKYINYRALPVLTASSAVEGAKGVTVPVDIKGPFNNIKVKPDYAGAISKILENPEDIKAAVKNVRENSKDIIKDFKKDPNAALNNLLGGGLFGKKKAAAPVEDPAMEPAPEAAPADDPNAIQPYTP